MIEEIARANNVLRLLGKPGPDVTPNDVSVFLLRQDF
jgi:hypothetical protein